jgi:hypothetical protein
MPPLSPIDPCESALISSAGAINRSMLTRIATQRARRELAAYAAIGAPRPWPELLGEELRRTWSIAKVMRECRQGRRDLAALTPAEQHIRQLEFRLERLRRGLRNAVVRQDARRYRALREATGSGARRGGLRCPRGDRAGSRIVSINRRPACRIPSIF